jgi:CDP-paratose 2-epimerase
VAAVYNLGGGRANSISLLEAVTGFEEMLGQKLKTEYVNQSRVGDHICYISDLRRVQSDYPEWQITYSLRKILSELVTAEER